MVIDLSSSTGVTLPALSLWMPWSHWVMLGWKTIETRFHDRFASLLGKRIAIHAAKTWDSSAISVAKKYLTKQQIAETYRGVKEWTGGSVICTAEVYEYNVLEPKDAKCALIECDTPRFGLFLRNRELVVPPLQTKGRQGIFRVTIPE